MSNVGYSK